MKESQEPSVLTKTAPSSKKPPMSRKKKIILWTIIGVLIVAIAVTVPLVVVSRNNKKEYENYINAHFKSTRDDGVYAKPAGKNLYKIYDRSGNFMSDFTGDALLELPSDTAEHDYYFDNGVLDTSPGLQTIDSDGDTFYYYHGRLMEDGIVTLNGKQYWVLDGVIQYDKTGNYKIKFSDGSILFKIQNGHILGYYEDDGSYVAVPDQN